DRRGRGLAARVTSAVTAALLEMRLRTVALNVNQHNAPAVRVYERLGYERYCAFHEGVASVNSPF
ncbi:MAG: N-acetyltransferase protein, partial [Anaerolineales bacterium]|nr:N-acetyltransferase protein [Anaerolineales bacterium]